MNIRECVTQGKLGVHFSLDDCILGLQGLFSRKPKSLFDDEYFGFLKELHEETGVIMTCYLFCNNRDYFPIAPYEGIPTPPYFEIGMADDRYFGEFRRAASWLKFSVHAESMQMPMTCETAEEVYMTIEYGARQICCFAGQTELPKAWRPHYFVAPKEACRAMQHRGVETLLTADDGRLIVACLRPAVVEHMQQQGGGIFFDHDSKFLLAASSFRVERETMTIGDQKRRIAEDLAKHRVSVFFTHEYQILPVWPRCEERRKQLRELLAFAAKRAEFLE